MRPLASIVVPTRNRFGELHNTLRSALAQSVPVEILVMNDGHNETHSDMIRCKFPEAQYYQLEAARGPAFQRNRGIELATTNFVFPLDDDAVLASPRTVEQTLADFDRERVGAVAIPYINVRQDDVVRQSVPEAKGVYVAHAFVGASHAVRRDVFMALGGFREHFFYMGEEGDFCLRMLEAGYVTRLGRADPIHHFESPRRNVSRAGFCGRRNDVLFAWHNVPMPDLMIHLIVTTINGFSAALTHGRFWPMLRGIASGWAACLGCRAERRPVSRRIYHLNRRLKKSGLMRLEEFETLLQPLTTSLLRNADLTCRPLR